jgi:hypothetical protein
LRPAAPPDQDEAGKMPKRVLAGLDLASFVLAAMDGLLLAVAPSLLIKIHSSSENDRSRQDSSSQQAEIATTLQKRIQLTAI